MNAVTPARRRRAVAGTAGALVMLVMAVPAWAYWTAGATTSATVTAGTLGAPAGVSVVAVSPTKVRLRVTAAPASGPTPSGYLVKRGGTTVCGAVALGDTCQDGGLEPGTVLEYTVFSTLGSWVSTPSATVSATTPVVDRPSTPALTEATDTGTKGDGFTASAPSFTGTAPAGSVVTLLVDGVPVTPTATVPAGPGPTTWTITPATTPATDVLHTVTARVSADGATSAPSGGLSLLVDTVRPTTGTPTATCAVPLVNSWCTEAVTVTVPSVVDAAPSSGLVGVDWSGPGVTSGSGSVADGTATAVVSRPDGGSATPLTVVARDGAGNTTRPARSVNLPRTDRTAPAVTSVALANTGGNARRVDEGDSVTIGLTDATSGVDRTTICSGWTTGSAPWTVDGANNVTVTVANAPGSTNDVLTVTVASGCTGFDLGTVALGADYVRDPVTFRGAAGNQSRLRWDGSTLTITLGAAGPGTRNSGVGPAAPVFTPAAGVGADVAGNRLPAAPMTGTVSGF